MNVKRTFQTALAACALLLAVSCTSALPTPADAQGNASATAAAEQGLSGEGQSTAPCADGAPHVYRTRLFEQLFLPGPTFTFEYPDGWEVVREECQPQMFAEHVTLRSDEGHDITFAFGNAVASTSGRTTGVLGEVGFNPAPYPALQLPGSASAYQRRERSDEQIRGLELQVRGWERGGQLGAGRGYYVTGSDGADPYYYGYFQFMCIGTASGGTDRFSAAEEGEVLQILGSLRQQPAPYDERLSAAMAAAYQTLPGTYFYGEDDGEGHVFVDAWQIDEDGTAARMGRMSKWDYTWRLAGGRDALGRPVVLLEPAAGNPVRESCELAYDEGLGALCEPGESETRYTR